MEASLKDKVKLYFWRILIALDQALNTICGGYPDETFSSRAHRKAVAGQWFWKVLRVIINGLFFWQKDHCLESYQSEWYGRHLPSELTK